jgi:hypothetical protein
MNTLLRALVVKSRASFVLVLVVLSLASFLPAAARGATIAHWSLDNDNGGIYADQTGLHDATVVLNGSGTITNEAAKFGNGITFDNGPGAQVTNNGYLTFSNLTELMGPEAGSYSVSAWAKTLNTLSNNPILADWGNVSAGQRFVYWFSLTNANGNADAQPRGQSRAGNSPNIDIFARNAPIDVSDGEWHHMVWTWDKPNTVLRTYVDGLLVDTNDTSPSSADMVVASSPIGAIGRKGDTNNYFNGSLDEIWVVEGVLNEAEILSLRDANVVPEPSSLALLAAAGLLILARRRR